MKKAEEKGKFQRVLDFMQPVVETLVLNFSNDTLFLDRQPILRFDWIVRGSHKERWGERVKELHETSEGSYKEIVREAKET